MRAAAQLHGLQGGPASLLVLVGQADSGSRGEHAARGVLSQLGQTSGLVNRVTNDRVLKTVTSTDVARDDMTGGDANASAELEVEQFLAQFTGGGEGVTSRVVEGQGSAEDSQSCVTLELVDNALIAVHTVDNVVEERIEFADNDLWRVLLREVG